MQLAYNAEKIVIALIAIIVIMQNTSKFIRTTTPLREKFLKIKSHENIKDVHAENLAVLKNIVNAIRQDYFVEISVNVYNVKITNL